jgi:hypothetical protein
MGSNIDVCIGPVNNIGLESIHGMMHVLLSTTKEV